MLSDRTEAHISPNAKLQDGLGSLKVWAASDSNTNLVNIPIDYVGRTRCHVLTWTCNLDMQHDLAPPLFFFFPKKPPEAIGAGAQAARQRAVHASSPVQMTV